MSLGHRTFGGALAMDERQLPRRCARPLLAASRALLQKQFGTITQLTIHNPRGRGEWMRLGRGGIENMRDFDTPHLQEIGNQTTMTTPPNRFCAHNRSRAALFRHRNKAIYTM